VLALVQADGGLRQLPRVPPRLAGERLAAWLSKNGADGGTQPSP